MNAKQAQISNTPKINGTLLCGVDIKPLSWSHSIATPPKMKVADFGGNQRAFALRCSVGVTNHMTRVNVMDGHKNKNGAPTLYSYQY